MQESWVKKHSTANISLLRSDTRRAEGRLGHRRIIPESYKTKKWSSHTMEIYLFLACTATQTGDVKLGRLAGGCLLVSYQFVAWSCVPVCSDMKWGKADCCCALPWALCSQRHRTRSHKQKQFEISQNKKNKQLCWFKKNRHQASSAARSRTTPRVHAHLQGFGTICQQSLYVPSCCRHQCPCIVGLHGEVRTVFMIYLEQPEDRGSGGEETGLHWGAVEMLQGVVPCIPPLKLTNVRQRWWMIPGWTLKVGSPSTNMLSVHRHTVFEVDTDEWSSLNLTDKNTMIKKKRGYMSTD